MLQLIFDRYWDICLLKESPENTPYSISRMVLSGILLALLMTIEWDYSNLNSSEDLINNAYISICLMISYVIYTYFVLYFRGVTSRLVQTVTTLYFINIIIHILVIPLLILAPYLSQIHLKNPLLMFIGIIYLFLSLGLTIWQFVITAHVYKYALDSTAIKSVFAAFGLIAVNVLTVSLLQ
ncbi:hypothetical protein OQJ18_05635 [Fluoribacter dumoffii]|uniref:Yip1 domain n=1 Tax=Fluoribacter dumoffii TaxID=463 RepID=A0A377G8Q3_9GAMM|nr:hypothetical protein [Fluoribacter dumoffii]KTC90079.1 hypothetical protein Ldum_1147 [Fluoribacter dumoffii NY 23]MCW8385378.1 hypothetical protein [Fluoribacter dumoffii]MCW8418431.1 hypothetical protein [Fluoribacter dumoffii]MCW8453727.1 hypothetical protein [Fluoribacter dumoffii]MCW8462202.1 hypothetical protein [Fluoribacter dumoffii]